MKAKITEIFRSIQGEGEYLGVEQIFVRFFGCNLNCSWCDTPKANGSKPDSYEEYTADEVMNKINTLNTLCHSISLTGGEPLLQKDFIKELCPKIHEMHLLAYLETNGTLVEELRDVIRHIDIIAMDIKLPSSTNIDEDLWTRHKEFMMISRNKEVFVKAVIDRETNLKDIESALDIILSVDPGITFILQPNNYDEPDEMFKICRNFQEYSLKKLKDVRVIPQMHKVWGIP